MVVCLLSMYTPTVTDDRFETLVTVLGSNLCSLNHFEVAALKCAIVNFAKGFHCVPNVYFCIIFSSEEETEMLASISTHINVTFLSWHC